MSKLSLFLPPFASDYSGACSVLFPFDCMVVILDAGCCTRNYAEYDEPRWTKERKPAFSAQIRTLDTVMGDEEGIISQVLDAARELKPACIALVGTPVPAIVGMDLEGMAHDIEREGGIPCMGIATNGFDTYDRGVSRALRMLVDRFALLAVSVQFGGGEACVERSVSDRALKVNLLGATPLDFADAAIVDKQRALLAEEDIEVVFDGTSRFGVADIAATAHADASIVATWGGLACARALRDGAGIPYVVGAPIDAGSAAVVARRIRRAVGGVEADGELPVFRTAPPIAAHACADEAAEAPCGNTASAEPPSPKAVLVGDQVMMGSLRDALLRAEDSSFDEGDLAVATFFSSESALVRAGDKVFAEDSDLDAYLKRHPDILVVGDPLLARLPSLEKERLVEAAHPAVSGQLFGDIETSGKELLDEIRLRAGA